MKVLAINSSPRKEGESKTELMLTHLVKGMEEAGAKVERINLREKTVKNCIGCFTCWTKTPGVCVHKDDMSREIFPKMKEVDLVVYASPLYHFTLNGKLKTLVERTLPMVEPFFVDKNGKTHHPMRFEPPPVVFLSVAGFPEESVFDLLSSWVRFIFQRGLVAEIYRPAAESLSNPGFETIKEDVLDATVQAGREIIKQRKVTQETMARVKQPIADSQFMQTMGNLFWKTCIAEGVTPKEFMEKGMVPRPDSMDTFMKMLEMGFNPEGARETRAILQFDFSGQVEGSCFFTIDRGTIRVASGAAKKPDLIVKTPFEVWMDIMTGKADGQQAFMEGKYQFEGDLNLLMRMGEFFRR